MKRIIVVSYKKKYKGFRLAYRKQDGSRTVIRTLSGRYQDVIRTLSGR